MAKQKNIEYGASFSLHRCRELGLNPRDVLLAAINDLGIKRFRIMSYWNLHEPEQGEYNFADLDGQLNLLAKHGCKVTLAIGKRQPRWPECHIPKWAASLPHDGWHHALMQYLTEVVMRYKDHPAIESWQLENEALLKDFGVCPDKDYSHKRLREEFSLVKKLDGLHPCIMTLSDSWGLPWRRPTADMYAMTLYRITIKASNGQYSYSKFPAWFYRLRAVLIKIYTFKPTFIHELQAEPWLNKGVKDTPIETQLKYMNPQILVDTLDFAARTPVQPQDLWGLEWWYWMRKNGHPEVWETIKNSLTR